MTDAQIFSRCIYDERVAGIYFGGEGISRYGRQVEELEQQYGTGIFRGKAKLAEILEQVQASGHGERHGCIIGVSGGTDSSYLLLKAKESGLRPIALRIDNSQNTAPRRGEDA